MGQIHKGLSIDVVDNVMYVLALINKWETMLTLISRENLREQHAVADEINEALTSGVSATGVDEDELDEELADLQQEQLDEQMLNTGNVPVADKVSKLPMAPQAEVKGKTPARVEEDDEEEELRKLQAEMAM
jgi:charged multivesicular body protein 4A/B